MVEANVEPSFQPYNEVYKQLMYQQYQSTVRIVEQGSDIDLVKEKLSS